MSDIDCARCGTAVDAQERHATVESEVVDPEGNAVEPSADFLCLDCYDDFNAFLGESDQGNSR